MMAGLLLDWRIPLLMSSTLQAVPPISSSAGVPERTLLAGLALTSFAALLLELALTRLFCGVRFYHFAFLAISIALLGLGAGGVFAYLLKNRLARAETRKLAARLSIDSSLVVLFVLEVVLHIPVTLTVSAGNFLNLTAIYISAALPFFLIGVQFSVIFARESRRIPRLYAADLLGGALACLAIVPLLNWLGGPNTILFAALMAGPAACVWTENDGFRKLTMSMAAGLIILIAANHSGRWIDIVYAKGQFRDKSWVEF